LRAVHCGLVWSTLAAELTRRNRGEPWPIETRTGEAIDPATSFYAPDDKASSLKTFSATSTAAVYHLLRFRAKDTVYSSVGGTDNSAARGIPPKLFVFTPLAPHIFTIAPLGCFMRPSTVVNAGEKIEYIHRKSTGPC